MKSSSPAVSNSRHSPKVTVLMLFIGWYVTLQLAYRRGQLQQEQWMRFQSSSSVVEPKALFRSSSSSTLFTANGTAPISKNSKTSHWEHLWWATNLKGSLLHLDEFGQIVFPPTIRRVWIDVGVHAKSEFLPHLKEQSDLFLIGFEPALTVYQPCPPQERCVILWAACTSSSSSSSSNNNNNTLSTIGGDDEETRGENNDGGAVRMVDLYLQRFGGMCNSLLRSTTQRGCVRPKLDAQGQPLTSQVPGIPLYSLLSRIPSHITVEYLKVDAQGYDLEVMKGAMQQQHPPPTIVDPTTTHYYPLPQIVSLEAMDVTNKSLLLYHDQPTLNEMIQYMQDQGWTYVRSTNNTALIKEVNAYFAYNASLAYKVDSIVQLHSEE